MKKLLLILFFLWTQISFAQIVDIPDANFKEILIAHGVDTNNDGEIQVSEAEAITSLLLSLDSTGVNSLEGILSFTNLNHINIWGGSFSSVDFSGLSNLNYIAINNSQLNSINLSGLINLEILDLGGNQLESLNISNFTALMSLSLNNNKLHTLNLSNFPGLFGIDCSYNQLSELNLTTDFTNLQTLNLSHNLFTSLTFTESFNNLLRLNISHNLFPTITFPDTIKLEYLGAEGNLLTSIDLSNQPMIELLTLHYNQLTSIDLSNLHILETLYIHANQLTSLDLSNQLELNSLLCHVNQLETLYIKNGISEENIILNGNPLRYVCTDKEQTAEIQSLVNSTCVVNSYCSFDPGGEVYHIQGNVKMDLASNGCGVDDVNFPFLQLKVTDINNNTDIYTTDTSGNYDIALYEGSYTIEYQFPYMAYFDISPSTFSVNFPSDVSPFVQDICLIPNGTYNDLQIAIIPLEQARPGFDTNYRIVYANVGTTPLSGDVTFTFDDDVLDYVSSSVSPDTQNTGELSWSFSNLAPLEVQTIDVTMNLNTPTETPPLNGGDILCYEATISPITNDEIPNDNSFSLKQTVVNSYDPNDKTCLEGNIITPDLVGEYVHYLIRFENTGSASAINVVVKDVIDTSKFDMSSFVPMNSSHDFITRIQNGNEVEFIFENINLPFDDATNDGFILFKIKTLPLLVVGDTFENGAEIYFDFNFPIITNVEQTTIDTTASNGDFSLNSNITLFPNPASNELQINSQLAFDAIVIYDLTGKEIKRIVSTQYRLTQEVDVSNLKSGIYYISIQSGSSKKTQKFLKS